MELLIVLAIIGLLSTLALPHIRGLTRSNVMAAANQQLVDDLALARQRAINSRSAVYMLFMPPIPDATIYSAFLNQTEQNQVLAWQYTSYTLFADRAAGDQPGRPFKRYLNGWKSLPDGVFIATNKFFTDYNITINGATKNVLHFDYGDFPYPTSDTQNTLRFAYIKFDEQGRLVSRTSPDGTCIIPLARGGILLYTDPATGKLQVTGPRETAGNNSADTNTYDHVEIDAFTGRARVDRRSL